ncbi:hypothetical protein BJ165DRAFT_1495177 [Panaeolus papilionaceus]|nr:hypothetical protein BJ165DRAFT_1495177 [Panaeolus papilionaceus]
MSLLSLYPELHLYLSQYLDRNEHKTIRLTCKTLADIFALVAVTKVVINTTNTRFTETIGILSGRSSVTNPPVHAIKKLDLTHRAYNHPADQPAVVPKIEDINGFLAALSSLVKVREISWMSDGSDLEFCSQMGAVLSSYPELMSLDLLLSSCFPLPIIGHFRNLKTLSCNASCFNPFSLVNCNKMDMTRHIITLAPILKKSPGLVNLSLALHGRSLGCIFGPSEVSALHLCPHHVSLNFCSSPALLLPHLQHLKVLELIGVGSRLLSGVHKSLNEFWWGMTDLHLQLEKITVDYVPDALVGYLQQYQGLESFEYDPGVFKRRDVGGQQVFSACSRDLCCKGLPSHSATLRKVVIDTQFEDEWAWSPDIQTGLAKCSALQDLGIGVTYAQLEASLGAASAATSYWSPIHLLLDSITQQNPEVHELYIHSQLPIGTNHDSRADYYSSLATRCRMVEESITSYVPRAEVKSLPKIHTIWKRGQRLCTCLWIASTSAGQPLSYKRK